MPHPLDVRMKAIVAALVDIDLREIVLLKGLIERTRTHALACGNSFENSFMPGSCVYKLVYQGESSCEQNYILWQFKGLALRLFLRFFDWYDTDFRERAERSIGGIKFWLVCDGPLTPIKTVLVSNYFYVERNRIRPHINNKMPLKSNVKVTTIPHNYPCGGWTDIMAY